MEDFLKQLLARRNAAYDERGAELEVREQILRAAQAAGRERLDVGESRRYKAHTKIIRQIEIQLRGLDTRIAECQQEIERSGQHSDAVQRVLRARRTGDTVSTHIYEPQVYGEHSRNSYMRDLVLTATNMDYDGSCRERLMRHAQDVATAPEYKEIRALSRTDGQGGYAVPPAWLMSQYIELARPGRAFADLDAPMFEQRFRGCI
jgi:hypothetical protein